MEHTPADRDLWLLPGMSPVEGHEIPPIAERILRIPRVTVGRSMIALAVLAGFAGQEIRRFGQGFEERRARGLAWIAYCSARERYSRHYQEEALRCIRGEHPDGRPTCPLCDITARRDPPGPRAAQFASQAAHWAREKERIRHALWRPWETIPDRPASAPPFIHLDPLPNWR